MKKNILLLPVIFSFYSYGKDNNINSLYQNAGKIYNNKCSSCHLADGSGGMGLKISNHTQDYIRNKLIHYKSKQKSGPLSYIMFDKVNNLSEQDINNLSIYISKMN